MRSDGQVSPLSFTVQTIDTDADHTGKATEAVVSLPQPLQPGASLELTSFYSGEVTQSAERLERIGAPLDQAARADWDQISPEWTALRGFGNVLWYPTAAAPVFLGDGAKLFQSVGQTKLQQAAATIRLRLDGGIYRRCAGCGLLLRAARAVEGREREPERAGGRVSGCGDGGVFRAGHWGFGRRACS